MAETAKKSNDELYAEWEAKWKAKDFSWEGLKKHEWRAPVDFPGRGEIKGEGDMAYRLSNLQEYWRWNLGQFKAHNDDALVESSVLESAGLLLRAGGKLWHIIHLKETDAVAHAALAKAISVRLRAAGSRLKLNGFLYRGPDSRAQLMGARAAGLNRLWRDYGGSNEPSGKSPILHVAATFTELKCFSGRALNFDNANFFYAAFTSYTDFSGANFTGKANFKSAAFTGKARFRSATFTGKASFDNTNFTDDADFSGAAFMSDAVFTHTSFTGNARFMRASLTGSANFSLATFMGDVDFFRTAFTGESNFLLATFKDDADFDSATFMGTAKFIGAKFTNNTNFRSAKFEHSALFTEAKWGWDSENKKWLPVHYGRAFYNAQFKENANFETDHFNAFAAFDGADFGKKLYLKDATTRDAHKMRFAEACTAVETQIQIEREDDALQIDTSMQRWTELSSGYQTVKAVMERNGDVERAQRYHRYEIEARLKRPTARPSEKVAAWLYKSASDYGASIVRPITSIAALWLVFAVVYFALSAFAQHIYLPRTQGEIIADINDALSLSFKNALLNIDSFGGTGLTTIETRDRLFGTGLISAFARFLGAVQTFLSLILAFLFGLAVRRKFQIR